MKTLLLLLFLGLSTIGFSQFKSELRDTLEAKNFWADNIRNIIELKEDEILAQTNFPVTIQSNRVERAQFKSELGIHFTEKIRSELKSVKFDRLAAWYIGDDTTPTYMVPCWEVEDKSHSFVVFVFFQFSGHWKLTEIIYI